MQMNFARWIMDNKIAIYNFLTGIECEKEKPTYDEAYRRAFQLAWKDMATHTIKISDSFKEDEYDRYFNGESELKKENKKRLKEQLADIIKMKFEELLKAKDESNFSDCHKKICEYIVEDFPKCKIEYQTDKKDKEQKKIVSIEKIYTHIDDNIKTFSYGQAQKLINMLVKYMYVYHKMYNFSCYDVSLDKVDLYHVPIDSYVLRAIGDKRSWSKINEYRIYENLQREISKKANEEHKNPFLWELYKWNNKFDID